MNIQELIKKYEEKYETVFGFPVIQLNQILEDLKQLDEQQKVKVPQFVADWYEKHKNNIDFEIWHYLHTFSSQNEDEFKKWMNKLGKKQIQTLVNMHQFGYEVEEEKKYRVKVKGMNRINGYLAYNKINGAWYFGISGNSKNHSTNHTRKELGDAGFGEVFNSPMFEIEEVEG